MMNDIQELSISSLFYRGQLFQIGDVVKGTGEYLHSSYGFTKYPIGGVLTAIYVKVDTVCNSCYLNHGFTYSSIGGLGFIFEIDGKRNYAFKNTEYSLPYLLRDKDIFITNYYLHPINKDKLDNLLWFINKEFNYSLIKKDINNVGNFLRKNYKELSDYIWLTFRIRQGDFGRFQDNNELSTITMKVMRENGFNNTVNNVIYKFTAANQPYNKPLFKSIKEKP